MNINFKHINIFLLVVLLHLLVATGLMFSKIKGVKETTKIEFEFERDELEEKKQLEEELEKKLEQQKLVEKQINEMISAEKRKNIAVNINEKLKEEISTEKYEQQIKEQLTAGRPAIESKETKTRNLDESYPKDANMNSKTPVNSEKPKSYQGPTTITFDLKNRKGVYLPVPVYKCQSKGKIVVKIAIRTDGMVVKAEIDENNSNPDDCLQQTALTYAKRSRFNVDNQAPNPQMGVLTYDFVAQ